MMVEADPTSSFVVVQSKLAFHFLIVAIDPPPNLGQLHKILQGSMFWNRRQPVLPRLSFPYGPVYQQPFFRPGFVTVLVSMCGSHTHRSEPGAHRSPCSLAPAYGPPVALRESPREFAGRKRVVSGCTTNQCRRSPLSAPSSGRKRLRTWRPQACFTGNCHGIGKSSLC